MLELPTELWRHIAEFLPPGEVKHLCSVNQAFYHLALDQVYREVTFDYVDKDMLHNIESLQNPDIARRVRSFHISSHLLRDRDAKTIVDIPADENFLRTKIKSLTSRIICRLRKPKEQGLQLDQGDGDGIPTSDQIAQSITDIISNMTEVHTYGVSWQNLNETDIHLIDVGWSSFAHSLQHLRLSLPPIHLSSVPHSIQFPNLETLYVKFLMGPDDVLTSESLQTLASFINQLHPGLQKLAIRASRTIDVSALFLSLGDFKHLASLDLDDTCTRCLQGATGVDPSIQFMNKHAATICDLSLVSKTAGSWLNFQHLHLQNLTTLLLNSNLLVPSQNLWSSAFLKSVGHTLTSLVVLGPLSRGELKRLLYIIEAGDSADRLNALSIEATTLTTELLVGISANFLHLDSLTLRIRDVSGPGTHDVTPGQHFLFFESSKKHAFANQMRKISFAGWALRDITIKRTSCCGELVLWGLMKLFAECIPTVKSFSGNGDMMIPDPPNQRRTKWSFCSHMVCSYGKAGTRTSREFPSNYNLVYRP